MGIGIQWTDAETTITFSELIASLTYALDMTEGQPPGHCLRSCLIGMSVGREMGLGPEELWNLYYSILLKDAGCSSNAARLFELYGSDDRSTKNDFKTVDTDSVLQVANFVFSHTGLGKPLQEKFRRILNLAMNGEELARELFSARCERGANIAIELGFNERVAEAVRCLDEHWNGQGRPRGLIGDEIPLASQIALMAQVADVFSYGGEGLRSMTEVRKRRGSWFDPKVVSAFESVASRDDFWKEIEADGLERRVLELEPEGFSILADSESLDSVARAFGKIIDAKSPYTFGHSQRVGDYTMNVAKRMGFAPERCIWVRRGGFLHDLGKLGVSNAILDKPGKLDPEEYEAVKKHAQYTEEILCRIAPFRTLAAVSGAHHERLDGLGYPRGIAAPEICIETRIITVADIFDALTEERPYRKAMSFEEAFSILDGLKDKAVDRDCLDVFRSIARELPG